MSIGPYEPLMNRSVLFPPPLGNWSAGRKIVWIPWNLSFHSLMAKNKLCEREGGLFRIFCWQMKINKFLLKYYFYLFFGNLNCYWVLLFKNHLFYQSLVKTRKILFWTDEISFQGNRKVFFVVDGFVRFFFWICLSKFSILMIDVNRKRFSLMSKSNNFF